MRRRWWVAALLLLAGCTTAAPQVTPAPATPRPATPRPSTPRPGTPGAAPSPDGIGRVAGERATRDAGALFHAGGGDHFCSGTVVTGDLVVTAAHCVTSGGTTYPDLQYAPAYAHGSAPYGRWDAAQVFVDPRWTAAADPDLDVAFLQLTPRDGRQVEDVVGAQRIAFGTPRSGTVRLTGYPAGADDPLTCLGTISARSDGQLSVACTGYSTGTSGSPWLTGFDPATRTWAVVGVIGGDEQGGDTDDVSYSPYFGPDVQQLYEKALSARTGSRGRAGS